MNLIAPGATIASNCLAGLKTWSVSKCVKKSLSQLFRLVIATCLCADASPENVEDARELIAYVRKLIFNAIANGEKSDSPMLMLLFLVVDYAESNRLFPPYIAEAEQIADILNEVPEQELLRNYTYPVLFLSRLGMMQSFTVERNLALEMNAMEVLTNLRSSEVAIAELERVTFQGIYKPEKTPADVGYALEALLCCRLRSSNLVESCRIVRVLTFIGFHERRACREALKFFLAHQGPDGLFGFPEQVQYNSLEKCNSEMALTCKLQDSIEIIRTVHEMEVDCYRMHRDIGICFQTHRPAL